MTDAEGAPLGGAISKSLVVWNGVRVGILGLSENWLPQCGQLKKEDWVYHDSEEVGERMAQELKRVDGAEVVIALCHNRFSKDIELSEKCPSIDLILGGHDHFYKNAPKYRTIKSGEEFEYLTEIELFIDQTSHQVKYRSTAHTITRDIPPHPAMETVIARFDKRLRSRMGKVIGTSSVPLDLTEACCRFKEGLVPGFIVDVMAMRSKADFAILGGAAISGKSIKPPGDITVGDIFSWFPNDTKIMTVRIKGRTVQKMLDVMVREVPNEAPSFPHPSSALNFTINTMRSPTVVQDIYVRGKPIEMDADYVVAVEDFVGLGKAKYKFIPVEGETLCDDEAAEQITYWIIDYFDCDDNRSEKADKKLSLLTNIAMRDTVFGLTDIRGKLTAGMAASTSQLLHESTRALSSSATSDIFARSIGRNDPGIAASVLAEARKLSQYQRSQLETVYFELEASLKRLVPCGQVRVFHFMENSGKAWFRGNNQQPRRIVVDNCGAFGSFYGAKTTKVLTGSIPYDGPFDIQAEGEHDVENRNFISIPIIFNKQALCSITLVNRQGGEFTDNDCDAVALLITQAQPIVAFAVAVQTKEAEEERIRTLITLAGDIVQSNDNTTVNDTLAKVTDHAKSIFGVEKASFYVFDKPKNELWTVRKSVNTQRQIEFVSKRKSATGAGILTTAIQMKGLARYSDSEATLIPNLDRMYERNALALPIWSRKEKDSLCGVLLIADKINGGFTQTDERLMGYLAPFIAIAIDTTTELEVLRTGVDRTRLRTFPVHELTRIRFKRGWGSVRSRVSYIASDRFKDKEARIAAGRSISDEAPSVVAILQTSEATALLV
eukprot:GILJ01015731.1.p1 GENE.GILJ01015731.1~~GILJ01015731.1.p1  ORF type:complete len:907 (-),score=95.95 GILJ01015731.1:18-2522(-)